MEFDSHRHDSKASKTLIPNQLELIYKGNGFERLALINNCINEFYETNYYMCYKTIS